MALLLLLPGPVRAEETWTKPYPGIQHLTARLDGPIEAHVVVVRLDVPGISVRASKRAERWQTVAEFGARAECAVAINGGFWTMFGQGPAGVAAGGGRLWSGVADDEEYGFFALTHRARPWISRPTDWVDPLPRRRLAEAVSGRPMVLERGRLAPELRDFPFRRHRHPRTAVGLSRDRRLLFLFAVDGRQAHSKGMNLIELARLGSRLGAWSAINLDGGGSTTLWIAAEGGLVNRPCRGERTVLNHLCVQQERGPTPPPKPEASTPEALAATAAPPFPTAPPAPLPGLRVILVREHWAPLAAITVVLVLLLAATRRRAA